MKHSIQARYIILDKKASYSKVLHNTYTFIPLIICEVEFDLLVLV